ncbi:MAG: hypothetical protein N4A48_14065 [Tepidibacter sp.]|jgi:hypothetical protein|uniref:hypothetical protein n=1 Tax=Tepidibacter sp. TaxID=2529387 RepID=UPI0025F4A98D|nr:hypothetical protein [Tepidibacter sp.]MCT4509854.1 hypothetical protein [Tepidibacter sp.]
MLLFQWGKSDGRNSQQFEVNLTRQFIAEIDEDDANTYQLSLTYYYDVSSELKNINSGNKWSDDFDLVDDFINYIRDHEVTLITQNTQILNVNLEFEQV